MAHVDNRLVRERVLECIDYRRLQALVKMAREELGLDVRPRGRGEQHYREAIEFHCRDDFAKVLALMTEAELDAAYIRVFHQKEQKREARLERLLRYTCGAVTCFVTGDLRPKIPEEDVRQWFAQFLVEGRGYGKEDLAIEFRIKSGHKDYFKLDMAVFFPGEPRDQKSILMVVECKRQGISDTKYAEAMKQLESYLFLCPNARYGILTTGDRKTVLRKVYEKADGKHSQFFFREEKHVPRATPDVPPLTVVAR
jgi:hypothetical protein